MMFLGMPLGQVIFASILTLMGAVISVLLTKLLIQNGKTLRRIDEGLKMLGEKIDEGFRKMDETMRMIADLIVSEGEKTRETIKSESQKTRELITSESEKTRKEIIDEVKKR